MILVDDLGIDQLSIYDDQNYYTEPYPYANTPNINRLADEGVRFTQARANPLCSPSRASLQSGMYCFANGVGNLIFGPNQDSPCVSHFTDFYPSTCQATPLADAARDRSAYPCYSFLVGKSHLGIDSFLEGYNPNNPLDWCGEGDDLSPYGWSYITHALHYDRFRGVMRGLASIPAPEIDFSPSNRCRTMNVFTHFYWIECERNFGDPYRFEMSNIYYTEWEADQLIGCLQTAPEPFLAVWCTIDPHAPFEEWPPYMTEDVYNHGFGQAPPTAPEGRGANMNTYFRAKLEYLDTTIGRVRSAFSEAWWDKLTVILIGDNGTQGGVLIPSQNELSYPQGHPLLPQWESDCNPHYLSTYPYSPSRMKGHVYEGGIRVPLIVSGATVHSSLVGTTSGQLVDIVYLHETIRELTWTGDSTGGYAPPPYLAHSQSFARAFQIPSGTCVRNYSYSGMFTPNTDFNLGPWKNEPAKSKWEDCYIRRVPNSSPPQYQKVIRKVSYPSPPNGPPSFAYELYQLDFSGLNNPEFLQLQDTNHSLLATMKGLLETHTFLQESNF